MLLCRALGLPLKGGGFILAYRLYSGSGPGGRERTTPPKSVFVNKSFATRGKAKQDLVGFWPKDTYQKFLVRQVYEVCVVESNQDDWSHQLGPPRVVQWWASSGPCYGGNLSTPWLRAAPACVFLHSIGCWFPSERALDEVYPISGMIWHGTACVFPQAKLLLTSVEVWFQRKVNS